MPGYGENKCAYIKRADREYDKSHPDQVGKPRSLYCGCPRCSPFSC